MQKLFVYRVAEFVANVNQQCDPDWDTFPKNLLTELELMGKLFFRSQRWTGGTVSESVMSHVVLYNTVVVF